MSAPEFTADWLETEAGRAIADTVERPGRCHGRGIAATTLRSAAAAYRHQVDEDADGPDDRALWEEPPAWAEGPWT